ncbi:hypothetical protein ACFLSA_01265 [Bacteroidota bacterium]
MKPLKILLFLLLVLAVLTFISVFFPAGSISISDKIQLKFIRFSEILKGREYMYVDITDIIKTDSTVDTYNWHHALYNYPESFYSLVFDTIKLPEQVKVIEKEEIQAKKVFDIPEYITPMQFPGKERNSLNPFFEALSELKVSNDLIRILHYGDSQIEGDRITSYVRNELQKKFGGSGIGLFPIIVLSEYVLSIQHEISPNWKRYSIFDYNDGLINHLRFGVMMSFCRYSPVTLSSGTVYAGRINIEKSNIAYSRAKKFNKLTVLYGFNRKPLIIEVYKNRELHDAEILLPNNELQKDEWSFGKPGTEIEILFRGEDSPDLYGVALDDFQGVAVDNIPVRGSKGLEFSKSDYELLRDMYIKLNVKLVMLQFGINLVPIETASFKFYEEELYKQLVTLKSLKSDMSILVIGISDASVKNNGGYVTHPNILKIREAQKKAAFRANCAFWDTFEAMGGENSMPSWVFHDPPLATKDFTHFSYRGSKIIAEKLNDALLFEYDNFIKNN